MAPSEASADANFEAFITFVRRISPDQAGRVPRWLPQIVRSALSPR